MYIVDMELHLTVQVHGVLVMTLLEMLSFLVLIITSRLMLITTRIFS